MICEREMSSAGGGKQLRKVMTECPMAENAGGGAGADNAPDEFVLQFGQCILNKSSH